MSYIVIVGGELHNKGAQAMTYTAVSELKTKYPKHQLVLLAAAYNQSDELVKEDLEFSIYPWNIRTQMKFLDLKDQKNVGLKELIKAKIKGAGVTDEVISNISEILKNTELIVDVSGYALSSQRGYMASLSYLYNVMIAKKYDIPIYLLPQSFGPFSYEDNQTKIIKKLIKENLNYPRKIFAREEDGYNHLQPFNLNNVVRSYDCVLQGSDEFTLENLFTDKKVNAMNSNKKVEVLKNSVAIIPNGKIMEHGNENELYNVYKIIIKKLIDNNKNVYLICHSDFDVKVAERIKMEYSHENKVILITDEFDCIQINSLIRQFEFVIASRYHAIIHGYKNSVPALVFGWAVKYKELLNLFDQEDYLFDVRKPNKHENIIASLEKMIQSSENESGIIYKKMEDIKDKNIFKEIEI